MSQGPCRSILAQLGRIAVSLFALVRRRTALETPGWTRQETGTNSKLNQDVCENDGCISFELVPAQRSRGVQCSRSAFVRLKFEMMTFFV